MLITVQAPALRAMRMPGHLAHPVQDALRGKDSRQEREELLCELDGELEEYCASESYTFG